MGHDPACGAAVVHSALQLLSHSAHETRAVRWARGHARRPTRSQMRVHIVVSIAGSSDPEGDTLFVPKTPPSSVSRADFHQKMFMVVMITVKPKHALSAWTIAAVDVPCG